jgi:hypothetical protein
LSINCLYLEEDRHRAQRAGFDYHMTKPVDPAALEALLARCGASNCLKG